MTAVSADRRDIRTASWLVWAPWVAAPLFCLLPIGGCAVATSLRHAAAVAPAPPFPGPAVARHGFPPRRVAPILTAASR